MPREAFPNYTQLPARMPKSAWWLLRIVTLVAAMSVIGLLFVVPQAGLTLTWQLLIPLLPLTFALVPGLWRNVCPMATLNQLPRELGFGRAAELSERGRKLALYLSIAAFVGFVLLRQPLFNREGWWLGGVFAAGLVLAFLGGLFFKGRSGWCGTFCPLAPLQKAYGHAPLLLVRNGYCAPCVGCQKNCYDFNPRAAFFSDLEDADPDWREQRRFFIALLPGLVFAFFQGDGAEWFGAVDYLLAMALPMAISIGLFYGLHNLLRVNFFRLASLYAMTALCLFYWFGIPVVADGLSRLFAWSVEPGEIAIARYTVVALGVAVVIRALIAEAQYRRSKSSPARASLGKGAEVLKSALTQTARLATVTERASGTRMVLPAGQTLLDALEAHDLPILSGCRMGMCGSDPVVIVEGAENIAPPDDNETATLRRLGLEGKARLACCCRPRAGLTIDLDAEPTDYSIAGETLAATPGATRDRPPIVIVGNGVAGISTAEALREGGDDRDIVVISNEAHPFYNRMGLESVLYGRAAMQGLYLLKDDWYRQHRVDNWLNTRVAALDPPRRRIILGTGESVVYDRLVLATGASARVPEAPGFELPGVFSLRDAEDAIAIRRWAQEFECRRAVVLGGGVLGIEAAEALKRVGMRVTIVHSGEYLMNRQLDLHAAVILKTFLGNQDIRVLTGNGIERIGQAGDLKEIYLRDGKKLISDIVLLCVGIRANVELAKEAGLAVGRGVLVDERMRSADPHIYSVGDAAELPGAPSGLWSVGSEQGKVAADAILGGERFFRAGGAPPVQLKVSGIDLKCFGRIDAAGEGSSISGGDINRHVWKHLKVRDGRIVGGVFVNAPLAASAAIGAARNDGGGLSRLDILSILDRDND